MIVSLDDEILYRGRNDSYITIYNKIDTFHKCVIGKRLVIEKALIIPFTQDILFVCFLRKQEPKIRSWSALAVLAEDLGLVPSTHIVAENP